MNHLHRRLATLLVLLVPFTYSTATAAAKTATEVLDEARKIVTTDGIQEQKLLDIGGIRQWVSIRGRHKENPILLFVHGGPGFTASPVSYYYMRDWEEYFTVVHWDQRAAGKTYVANDPAVVRPTLSIERMVDDAEELVASLRETYGRKRIVLMGHSWGSIVGVRLVQKHPDWFYAYVGMGQFVEFERNEASGYQTTLAAAREANNQEAVAQLTAMAPFPDKAHPERNLQNLPKERRWLATYGGYYWNGGFGHNEAIAQFSPDYSAADMQARNQGMGLSGEMLWGSLASVDLTGVTTFKCPVIFMHGRHDLGTSALLLADWYKTLRAPKKQLIWFDDSAHMVYEEEPGKVLVSLVEAILPLTRVDSRH